MGTMTNLHRLLERKAAEAEVLEDLAAHPESAKKRDERGRLPLLIAVRQGFSGEVVSALL